MYLPTPAKRSARTKCPPRISTNLRVLEFWFTPSAQTARSGSVSTNHTLTGVTQCLRPGRSLRRMGGEPSAGTYVQFSAPQHGTFALLAGLASTVCGEGFELEEVQRFEKTTMYRRSFYLWFCFSHLRISFVYHARL